MKNIQVPDTLHLAIRTIAKADGVTNLIVLNQMLREYLSERPEMISMIREALAAQYAAQIKQSLGDDLG